MRKIQYLLFLVLFFVSCSQKDTKTITFPGGLTYSLLEDEQQMKLNQQYVDQLQSFFVDPQFQIPLYRFIQGTNHNTYIALPINTSLEEIKAHIISSYSATFFNEHEYFRSSEINGKQVVEYGVECKGSLIFLLFETNVKESINDELTLKAIQSRFQ